MDTSGGSGPSAPGRISTDEMMNDKQRLDRLLHHPVDATRGPYAEEIHGEDTIKEYDEEQASRNWSEFSETPQFKSTIKHDIEPVLYGHFVYDEHWNALQTLTKAHKQGWLRPAAAALYRISLPEDTAYPPKPRDNAAQWLRLQWEADKFIDRLYRTFLYLFNLFGRYGGVSVAPASKIDIVSKELVKRGLCADQDWDIFLLLTLHTSTDNKLMIKQDAALVSRAHRWCCSAEGGMMLVNLESINGQSLSGRTPFAAFSTIIGDSTCLNCVLEKKNRTSFVKVLVKEQKRDIYSDGSLFVDNIMGGMAVSDGEGNAGYVTRLRGFVNQCKERQPPSYVNNYTPAVFHAVVSQFASSRNLPLAMNTGNVASCCEAPDRDETAGGGKGGSTTSGAPPKLPPATKLQNAISQKHELIVYDSFNAFVNAHYGMCSAAEFEREFEQYRILFAEASEATISILYRFAISDAEFYGISPHKDGTRWETCVLAVVALAQQYGIPSAPMEPTLYNLNHFRKDRYHYSRRGDSAFEEIWEVEVVRSRQWLRLVSLNRETRMLCSTCPYSDVDIWAANCDNDHISIPAPAVLPIEHVFAQTAQNYTPPTILHDVEMLEDCDVLFTPAGFGIEHKVDGNGDKMYVLKFILRLLTL